MQSNDTAELCQAPMASQNRRSTRTTEWPNIRWWDSGFIFAHVVFWL